MAFGPPVTPRPAATVVLLRENEGRQEVFLTKRPDSMSFLGGYYVFPGGRVDKSDLSIEADGLMHGIIPTGIETVRDDGHDPAGFIAAAVRELFEEAGVLLLCDRTGASVSIETYWEMCQKPLDSAHAFVQEVRERELYFSAHRLSFLQLFITPAFAPIRFYTVFLKAILPEGQEAGRENREVERSFWIPPEEALEKNRTGEFPMIPPTLLALRLISGE